MDIIIILIILK